MSKVASRLLLSGATGTGAGTGVNATCTYRTFQAYGTTSSGAGAATIKIQVSNDNSNWLDLGTISLTLATTASSDGFASSAKWQFVRANVTAISGTGASVSVLFAE